MPSLASGNMLLHGLRQHVRRRVPDDAAAVVGVGGDRRHLDVGVRRPGQVAQPAVGVADDDDRVGGTPARQARLTDRRPGGRPGSDPDRGCWGGAGGRRSSVTLSNLGRAVFARTRPCYRCGRSVPRANRALQPRMLDADELDRTSPSAPSSHSVATTISAVKTHAEDLDPCPWRRTSPSPCRSAPWRRPAAVAPSRIRWPGSPSPTKTMAHPGPGYGIARMPTAEAPPGRRPRPRCGSRTRSWALPQPVAPARPSAGRVWRPMLRVVTAVPG